MTIKELEAKIQKIFNNDNLRVKGNHGIFFDDVIIFIYKIKMMIYLF